MDLYSDVWSCAWCRGLGPGDCNTSHCTAVVSLHRRAGTTTRAILYSCLSSESAWLVLLNELTCHYWQFVAAHTCCWYIDFNDLNWQVLMIYVYCSKHHVTYWMVPCKSCSLMSLCCVEYECTNCFFFPYILSHWVCHVRYKCLLHAIVDCFPFI